MSLDWLLRPQLEAFAERGYDVVTMSAPDSHVETLTACGIAHHAVPSLRRSVAPGADLRALRDLYRRFRDLKPDIVHTHNPKPGVLGRLAARAARVPTIVNTVHGLYATPDHSVAKRSAVYGAERLAAACSSAELYQNEEDMALMARLGVPANRQVLLGNGIDLERFTPSQRGLGRKRVRAELGIADDELVVGIVGRLVWEKGYREVFAAARALGDLARFVVVGPSDSAKPGAVDLASIEAAKQDGVVFVGHRADMVDLYEAFDVFVLASYREGFPRSLMEASAMGLPVVATDIRGCRQAVKEPETGTLVPRRDAARLQSAIERLLWDPELRRRQGEQARRHARDHFDDQRVIEITLDAYERLRAT